MLKISLKIINLETTKDIQKIRSIVSNQDGIIACEINKSEKEITIVFDNIATSDMEIIESIENEGYSVE